MTDLHKAARQALWAFQCHVEQTWPTDRSTAAIAALRAALAQQDEPKGGGRLPPPLQDEPAQEPVGWLQPKTRDAYLRPDLGYETCSSADYGAFPVYTAPPQRLPLAEWQINDLMAGIDPEDVCSWSFRQGVYAAEKHHGVKP